MKRIATVLAPFALVFAAAGVQASEISHGDLATQPVRAAVGPAASASPASPASPVAPAAPAAVRAGQRMVSDFVIGA